MLALDYLLPQPPFDLTADAQAGFEELFDATPLGCWIDYRLPWPKWQFLSWLCRARPVVLHGSQNPDILEVEPRQARDSRSFSAQQAVYATTDGLWVIFFAILDRAGFAQMTLFNSCLDIHLPAGQVIGPLYFFSVTHSALVLGPWCEGAVYILPRAGYEQEPARKVPGAELVFPHWISARPARPAARLHVGPRDFPFLAQIHGHDDVVLSRLASADPDGFPWLEALVT